MDWRFAIAGVVCRSGFFGVDRQGVAVALLANEPARTRTTRRR